MFIKKVNSLIKLINLIWHHKQQKIQFQLKITNK